MAFLYERIFTIVRKINYNEVRFTFLEKEGDGMERMFSVLGFWTGIFSVMFYVGYATGRTTILGQTGFFVLLSYLKLTERMYIYVFGAYLTVFFIGFTYYTTFLLVPGAGH